MPPSPPGARRRAGWLDRVAVLSFALARTPPEDLHDPCL
jgi:hypothetical protein